MISSATTSSNAIILELTPLENEHTKVTLGEFGTLQWAIGKLQGFRGEQSIKETSIKSSQ